MPTATPETSTTPLGPVTSSELLAALDAWQQPTTPRSGAGPVTAASLDDGVVIDADLEALARRQMSLELTDLELR